MNRRPGRVFKIAVIVVIIAAVVVGYSWVYTTTQLQKARSRGVYPSAEAGMRSQIEAGYIGVHKIEIDQSGPDSFFGSYKNVWYVIAKVWADSRFDGSRVGAGPYPYDWPGTYFLYVGDGWVHMPEHEHPVFIGFWMKFFRMAG